MLLFKRTGFNHVWTRLTLLFGITLALFGLGWWALSAPTAMAQEGVIVTFTPAIANLPVGQSVPVSITVQNVEDLYGLELDIYFDPSILTVESIAPGDFLSADFVVEEEVDADAGGAFLAYTKVGGEPQAGSGVIGVLSVRRTNCLGESPLQLRNVILSDNNGFAISHTLGTGKTSSGIAPTDRSIRGAIYHDVDDDGAQGSADTLVNAWPVYAQRYSLAPVGPIYTALTTPEGEYQLAALACGRYQLWSQNGDSRVLTRTVDLTPGNDLQLPALPLTGTLEYPLQRVYLPGIER